MTSGFPHKLILFLVWQLLTVPNWSQDDNLQSPVAARRGDIVRRAVAVGSPCVGHLSLYSEENQSTRAASALILTRDGVLVTSSTFASDKPLPIWITGEEKIEMKWLGVDHKLQIAFLMPTRPLSKFPDLCATAMDETASMRVGQTILAVSRTLDPKETHVSGGIVSALKRLSGKATQTDARIAPFYFGGAAITLKGTVAGMINPMTVDQWGTNSSSWYDGGVGFFVPIHHIRSSLKKIQDTKNDLQAGVLGIQFQNQNPFSTPLIVATVLPNSPADQIGIGRDDQLISVDGQPVRRLPEFKTALMAKYAGDPIQVQFRRGDREIRVETLLVNKALPKEAGYLGILASDSDNGPIVEAIDSNSINAKLFREGDLIKEVDQRSIESKNDLRSIVRRHPLNQPIDLTIMRAGNRMTIQCKVQSVVNSTATNFTFKGKSIAKTGFQKARVPVSGLEHIAIRYDFGPAKDSNRILMLVSAHPMINPDEMAKKWESIAQLNSATLLLVGPKGNWNGESLEFIRRACQNVKRQLGSDVRVTVLGEGESCETAIQFAQSQRTDCQGVILVSPSSGDSRYLPVSDIANSLEFLIRFQEQNRLRATSLKRQLEKNMISVTFERSQTLNSSMPEDLKSIGRWIYLLDRI